MLPEKLIPLLEAQKFFQTGSIIAIGGQSVFMNPMGLIKELMKSGCKSINLVASPVGGLGIDLLIGAGLVNSVEFAQVSLWEYGLAPNLRRHAESGRLKLKEHA